MEKPLHGCPVACHAPAPANTLGRIEKTEYGSHDDGVDSQYQGIRFIRHEHGAKDQQRLHRIDNHHGFVVLEPEIQQAMMDVVLAGAEPVHPMVNPLCKDPDDIRDRQPQQQRGKRRTQRGIDLLRQQHSQKPQRIAQELAAPVAHENPRGMGVEAHETEQPANGGERNQRDGRSSSQIGKIGDTRKTQHRLTAGQAIQPVGMIDGIDHADHRENGKRPADCRGYRFTPHERQMGDEHIPVVHHGNHRDELADELDVMPQFPAVIHDAEPEHHQRTENIGFQRWVERQQQHDRQQRTEHDAHATDPGNGDRMHLARVRFVDHPETRRQAHHDRDNRHTDHQRDDQRQDQRYGRHACTDYRRTRQITQMQVDDGLV